jgi:hypothetical protein
MIPTKQLIRDIVIFLTIAIIALWVCTWLTSCNPVKRATYIFDAHKTESAKYCAERHPAQDRIFTKTEYKKGKAIREIKHDTIEVDCPPATKPSTVRVPYAVKEVITVHDTLIRYDSIVRVDKANTVALQAEINELKSRPSYWWLWLILGAVVGLGVGRYLK